MPRPQVRNVLGTSEKPRKAGVAKAERARGLNHMGDQVRHVRTISVWLCKP